MTAAREDGIIRAGTIVGGFDYGDLPAATAQTLRNAATCIRNIQHAAISDVGRHLLDAKEILGHGPFLAWAATELGMSSRTAQRAMGAARFLDGKCVTVSHLPHSIIYKLSAPSAPAAVVEAVVAELETGTPLPVQEINQRLDKARAEEKAVQQEIARAAQTKEQRLTRAEAKDRIDKRKADALTTAEKHRLLQDALAREWTDRIERMKPVIQNIAKTLTDENLVDLVEMLKEGWRGKASVISVLQCEQGFRAAPEDRPIVSTRHDPTEWQNKRDYCLSHTAGLTGGQQNFLATLGRLGDPTSRQLDTLEHIHNTAKRAQS